MADTLSSLVDKLSTTNNKLFVMQDRIHKAAKDGVGLDPETTSQLVALNLQRNALMSELDQTFADAIKTGTVRVDHRVKIV